MLFALLGLHAVTAACAPVLTRRIGRAVFLVCAFPPTVTVLYASAFAPALLDQQPHSEALAWAPSLGVTGTLRLDAFAFLMVLLVSGIGAAVFLYAYGYFSKPRRDLGRFAATLMGFSGAMLGVVLSDNLLLLFGFWELTSITSYLLIGFDDREAEARDAALQALLTTGIGSLAMLGGFLLIGQAAGTFELSELAAAPPPATGGVGVGLVLVLLGAFTKSAQVPFHTWLPGAMAAPTPVSAYLHSATMVKAGVYLIARLAPIFAAVGFWRPLVVGVGVATMLVGAYRALRQVDLKLLLAFGTVSQLGFLVALLGFGAPETTFAGTAMLLAHGLFKAALFMVVGIIDKQAGTRNLRRLAGAAAALPVAVGAGALAAASMAGLPPLLGFVSKEAAFEALLHVGTGGRIALAGVVLASVLTFAYSARFVGGALGRLDDGSPRPSQTITPAGWAFLAPAVVLAALGLLVGLVPWLVDSVVNQAAVALDPRWETAHLALWHGLNLPLTLSALVVAGGLALYRLRDLVELWQADAPRVGDALAAYEASLDGLLGGARRLTGVVQNGSLPRYLTVILITVLALPGVGLVRALGGPLDIPFAEDPLQLALALLLVVGTVSAVGAGRRLPAALFLGAVGYGVALVFVLYGAPDLALTQLLIETLTLLLFVLVLSALPRRFGRTPTGISRRVRLVASLGVGIFVTAFALVAGAARTAPSVSGEYIARALPEAEGRNIVNTILVDFRAFDTMGEIVVLAVAALGVAHLVRSSRLERRDRARAARRTEAEAGEGGA